MDDKWHKGFANPYGPYLPGSKEYVGKMAARALIDQEWRPVPRPAQTCVPQTYAPKQAPVVYGPQSATNLKQSGGWMASTAELYEGLCTLAFVVGLLYGALTNQFNPFVPAYHVSEGGFTLVWNDDDSATQKQEEHTFAKIVATAIISPVVLSGSVGAFVGDVGVLVFRGGTYLVTKAMETR